MTWQALVPDSAHTFCTTASFVAAKTATGTQAVIYGTSASMTVVVSQMSGPFVRARWYDPTTGTYTADAASPFAATGSKVFAAHGTNAGGGNDWVLVLDSVASAEWPNEPAGWVSVGDMAFNTVPAGGDSPWESGWSSVQRTGVLTRATDATAPISPSFVGDFYYPTGFGDGSEPGVLYRSAGGGQSHYAGYTFKYSNGFVNQAVGTKQWYPNGASSDYFVLWENAGTSAGRMKIEFQPAGGPTVRVTGGLAGDIVVVTNVWYKFEILVEYGASTIRTRWWLAAIGNPMLPVGDHTRSWNTSHTFAEWTIAPTWGGDVGSTVPAPGQHFYVDHLHVSHP